MRVPSNSNEVFTDIIRLDYADLAKIVAGVDPFTGATLATAGQLPIAKKPAFGAVQLCGVAETTALAGASDIVFDIGTTAADPDEYIDALDVDAMTAPVFNTGDAFIGTDSGAATTSGVINVADATNAAEDIILEVGGTAGDLTAGVVVIGLSIVDLGKFA